MANANVRFYKLATLPNFEEKHKGIFVHVTSNLTRRLLEDKVHYEYSWDKLTDKDIQDIVIQKIVEKETPTPRLVLVPEWMDERRINIVKSGLWFGGENGWELLSNDTTDAAIDAAIDAKIKDLDVPGYAQAEITTDTPPAEGVPNSSTLTIKGIKEVDGKIGIPADSENLNLKIAIDGVYDKTNNKIATQDTVTKAIGTLDVNTAVQAVTFAPVVDTDNTILTFKGIKETNGVIAQGDEQNPATFVVGDAKLKIQIGSNEAGAFEVFSANAKENGAIKLNEYVFKKDNNNVISVITPTALASDNRLVTEKDIANLGGAMHYKGTVSSLTEFQNKLADSDAEEAGDVYIATGIPEGSFIHNGNTIENGDMIVFNSASEYKVIQSNITLGINSGQIAKNDGNLTPNNMVIATSAGIKTIDITETQLTGADNNTRTLSYTNGTPDGVFHHDVTITDTFKVIGKDFNQSIKISSTNRSIEIAKKTVDGADTGVMVDLVWNTRLE